MFFVKESITWQLENLDPKIRIDKYEVGTYVQQEYDFLSVIQIWNGTNIN